ncbi:MAG: hypothetical protein JXC33_02935 [Deltaproteobacteria bacterium]|nr:hypothetical protein [Deltaproteobacteria bacterium]
MMMCIYTLTAASNLIFAAGEPIMADVDPNEMRFKRTGCFDVGVKCGKTARQMVKDAWRKVFNIQGTTQVKMTNQIQNPKVTWSGYDRCYPVRLTIPE